jgi:hypothetical protein
MHKHQAGTYVGGLDEAALLPLERHSAKQTLLAREPGVDYRLKFGMGSEAARTVTCVALNAYPVAERAEIGIYQAFDLSVGHCAHNGEIHAAPEVFQKFHGDKRFQ